MIPLSVERSVVSRRLLGLGKEHEHPWPFISHQLILLLLIPVRHSQPVAGPVIGWFAVHQQHVVMRAVTFNVMEGYVPGVQHAVPNERHLLPVSEGTHHFDGRRIMSLTIGKAPTKDFAVSLTALS